MSWWEYVIAAARGAKQKDIATAAGVDQSTVSRWKQGHTPDPKNVITFARAYGKQPIEALLVAGLISEIEAKARPAKPPRLEDLTDDELVKEVLGRMQRVTKLTSTTWDVSDAVDTSDPAIAADEQGSIDAEQESTHET